MGPYIVESLEDLHRVLEEKRDTERKGQLAISIQYRDQNDFQKSNCLISDELCPKFAQEPELTIEN